jgi:prophage maintenance system killer protein
LRRPPLELAVAFNRAVREVDEWFDEPDDLERVKRAMAAIATIEDPVEAAAVLACGVARTQGFTEGNKRTALLLARWLLDHNGVDGALILPATDREFADILVRSASGLDVGMEAVALLKGRGLIAGDDDTP